jgi:hypothetical protein
LNAGGGRVTKARREPAGVTYEALGLSPWARGFCEGLPCWSSFVEKILQVGATFYYRSRSFFKVGLYSFLELSPDLHLSAPFQANFIRSIPKLWVLF